MWRGFARIKAILCEWLLTLPHLGDGGGADKTRSHGVLAKQWEPLDKQLSISEASLRQLPQKQQKVSYPDYS